MNDKLLTKYILLIFLLAIALVINCKDKPTNPIVFNLDNFPAAPINIKAAVGDGVVVLTWSHPQAENVESYKVYRQDSTGQTFRNIGTTDQLSYTDRNLQNNREFRYKVSAVGKNGLEGSKSQIVMAVPAVYGVTINSGQEFTNSRTVTLTFTAPATTSLIKISNDSLLADAQWESFVAIRNWTLSPNDGGKKVFVKFRDAEDRETIKPSSDSILLDTEAFIKRVTEDSQGRVLTAADTIHFTVETDEPGGSAWVGIVRVQEGIKLFDDGTNGDFTPNDGIYEVDYEIPNTSQIEGAVVTGSFIDRVGNRATNVRAPGLITIRRPPVPVKLIQVAPEISSSTALNLFWSMNSDEDFANYRIYRSIRAGVDTESPLVTIIQDQNTVSYTDTTLVSNTTYFYRVYVFDTTGLFSASNEESGTTNNPN